MNSLTIARFKNGYIKIEDYNKSIHRQGEVFCPFCDPPLEVTGVENKYFRALPMRGGHNCGRRAAIYLDADWEGRRLVETVGLVGGEIEVTIDINQLGNMGRKIQKTTKPAKLHDNSSGEEEERYNRYLGYVRVVRDIVRTVTQMKNFITKNTIDELNKIKFKYKMGDEELSINEVVKLVDELEPNLHRRQRFVIYKVESVKIQAGTIYINSYETNGINLATSFKYPSKENKTNIHQNDYVIAFGTVNYYEPKNKYYLNTLSDLNIVKMKADELKELFEDKVMTQKIITRKTNEPNRQLNLDKRNTVESQAILREPTVSGETIKKEEIIVRKPEIQEKKEHIVEEIYITANISKSNSKKENKIIKRVKSISNNVLKIFKR